MPKTRQAAAKNSVLRIESHRNGMARRDVAWWIVSDFIVLSGIDFLMISSGLKSDVRIHEGIIPPISLLP